jgi:hypothetical protein
MLHWMRMLKGNAVPSGLWTCPVNPHLMYIWCNIYLLMQCRARWAACLASVAPCNVTWDGPTGVA